MSNIAIPLVILVLVAVATIIFNLLQAHRLVKTKSVWRDEAMAFKRDIDALSRKKMDNVVRAYALELKLKQSHLLTQSQPPKFTVPRNVICENRRQTKDVTFREPFWLLAVNSRSARDMQRDVKNKHVQYMILVGRVYRIRMPVPVETEFIEENMKSDHDSVAFVIAADENHSLTDNVGCYVNSVYPIPNKGTLINDVSFLSAEGGEGGSTMVHAWGYKTVQRPYNTSR